MVDVKVDPVRVCVLSVWVDNVCDTVDCVTETVLSVIVDPVGVDVDPVAVLWVKVSVAVEPVIEPVRVLVSDTENVGLIVGVNVEDTVFVLETDGVAVSVDPVIVTERVADAEGDVV